MTIAQRIIEWNKSRNNLEYNHDSEYDMLHEELEKEFKIATTDDMSIDALCDLIVVATGAIWKMGYDPDKCMDECIKHISSRRQDPTQKAVWGQWGAAGKWLKDKSQTDVYMPNYKECVK